VASGTPPSKKISTTALAKLLDMDPKQLFELLVEKKWIVREKQADNSNLNKLTNKGVFEGGEYLETKKFGTYIIWPNRLSEHHLFKMQPAKALGIVSLAKSNGISNARMHGILQEMGWLNLHIQGWQLTPQGLSIGGSERQDEKTGASYVMWPSDVQQKEHFKNTLASLAVDDISKSQGVYTCLDGHNVKSKALLMIDNWLYCTGLVHAVGRSLLVDNSFVCDFYLPQGHIYLEFWGSEQTPVYLKEKMAKKALYKLHALNVIELHEEDLSVLDTLLPKLLLHYGIKVS
jgi:hypothetical protein